MSQRQRRRLALLDTDQLSKIKDELSIYGFPDTKWFDLGLTLGLKHKTLKTIEANHKDNVSRCLLECLNKWLSKADDVAKVGPPTWDTLGNGLRRIEEVAVAEKVLKMADPASQLLQRYSDRLSQVVFPEESLLMLCNEGVISNDTLAEIESCGDQLLRGPLRAVCTTVAEDHNKLRVLTDVLLKSEETVLLANEMIQEFEYGTQGTSNNTSSPSRQSGVLSGNSSRSGSTDISNNQAEFDIMRDNLGSLIHTIAPLIKAKIPSLEDLKIFLRRCRQELRPQLKHATTFDNVMELIEGKCSVFNITLLERIVDQYSVTDANQYISAYKTMLEEFYDKENSLTICNNMQLQTVLSSHLIGETIKLSLNWDIEKHTLNDVRNVRLKAFRNRANRVELVNIKEDYSITVTCYAPHYLMESLLLIARENLDELKEMGLMSLTIGYHTLYDQRARDKEILQLEEENMLLTEQLALFQTEKDDNKIQDGEELADNQQEENTQSSLPSRKRGHPRDEDDHSVMSSSRKPCYDEPATTRQTSRKRSHSSSSDDMSPSKMIALKHDTDILRQSVQEKESEIDILKISLVEKEKEIEALQSSVKEMKKDAGTSEPIITDLMKKLQTQETLAKQKTREIEGLKAVLRAKQLLTDRENENESIGEVTQFGDSALKIPSDFDQLLQSIGVFTEGTSMVSVPDICYPTSFVSYQSLKDIISNPKFKIKVRRALVLFTGLPKSGKSKAFNSFVGQHVRSNPLLPLQMEYRPVAPNDISHYDLIAAADSKSLQSFQLTKATKESSCIFGILSAFLQQLLKENTVPDLVANSKELIDENCFHNLQLNEHIHYIYQYLQSGLLNKEGTNFVNGLMEIPDEYALVNMWDVPTNNIIHHILLQLQGHLTKNYLCQFLNLERDLENLQRPPEMERGGDHSIIMKWRPRHHYLLRSCRLSTSDSQVQQRKNVVTIFAEYYETFSHRDLKSKVEKLEEIVQTAAVHTGVSELLNDRIETIDVQGNLHPLSQNIKEVVFKTQVEEIPIAWLFLRSFLHYSEERFITKKALATLAEECGMNQQSLKTFCKFYMSFGSIFDLSLVDSRSQYVIIKPIHFLRSLRNFLRLASDEMHRRFPTIKLGIVTEKAGRTVFIDDWPAYENALVCLKLATEVEINRLDLSAGSNIDPDSKYYYIPLSHTGQLMANPDPHSIHLITSINTPDVFKEVALVEKLLKLLPKSKLVPCSNSNQIVIKDCSTGTTVTFVSYGPAVKLHLDRPNGAVCEAIVQVYNEIARNNDVTVKYMFVKMCIEGNIPNARYLPSAPYHILPTDKGNGLCDKCEEEHDPQLLKVWNEALHKCPIRERSKPSGQLKPGEKTSIANKIASLNIDVIAKTFDSPDYREKPELKSMSGPLLINELISLWERKIERIKGAQEPRRAFARKITELWDNTLHQLGEVPKGWKRKDFLELANSVDLYYIVDL